MQRRLLGVIPALALVLAASFPPANALASSHSEAPGTSKDRLIDDTDLYAWVAKDAPGAVTIVGNWVPLIEPNSGPNFASFDDDAHYYINVDNVGDAHKHLRFEFTFKTTHQTGNTFLYNTGVVTSLSDPDLNVRQFWTLTRIDVDGHSESVIGSGQVAPYFVGPRSMPDYASLARAAVANLPGGYKVFVGVRDDPFFVDLAATFDLLTIRKPPGNRGEGIDGVGGYNVMSIVLQVPKERVTKDGLSPDPKRSNNIIGIWGTAERLKTRTINGDGTISNSGEEVQVSRLGMPLVNEVVVPLALKDKFNASQPADDVTNFGAGIVDPELAKLLHALYGIKVPPAPRNDIVAVFATGVTGLNQPAGVKPGEMLRLNLSIPPAVSPKRLGVLAGDIAGFPNGRRLTDDIVDIEERVVAGVLVPGFNIKPNNQLGDGVNANDRPFLPYFPYVAPPQNPFDHEHHAEREDHGRDSGHGRYGAESDDSDGDAAENETEPAADDLRALATAPNVPELRLAAENPSDRTVLEYSLPKDARISLRIFDVQGRTVRELIEQDAASGVFRASWDGRSDDGAPAGRGVFFARLVVDGRAVDTKRIVIR